LEKRKQKAGTTEEGRNYTEEEKANLKNQNREKGNTDLR
jgi:hypothetical protein